MNRNLPPLTKILAKGPEAGMEFERLIKKLLIHDGKRHNYVFEPGATYGDFGCDGWVQEHYPGVDNPVLFQVKWLQSGLDEWFNAQPVKESLKRALARMDKVPFRTFILFTPNDLTQKEKDLLKGLPERYETDIRILHFGHTEIMELLDHFPAMLKYYYGVTAEGASVNFQVMKDQYIRAVAEEHKYIDFIGMPTGNYREQQMLQRPEMAQIYIPLEFLREKTPEQARTLEHILKKYKRVVVLGDPGSGKSTLAKHLALIHVSREAGLSCPPMIIPVRDLARKRQERNGDCSIIDYLQHVAVNSFQMQGIDRDFFIAMLTLGQALVVFDGLDEIASEAGRQRMTKDIRQFSLCYPDARIWVTSRIVGYSASVRLEKSEFQHYYLAPVSLDQAKAFIRRWYEIQSPGGNEHREKRIAALQRAVAENPGVLRLRENPLLLTMMTLIHQFEGSLPEDRAKLYQGCIKLLLETWQEIKLQALGIKSPLAERGVKYEEQVRLLSAAAFYIQDKNQHEQKDDTRGLIRESELAQVLFEARFNRRRMTEEEAREDIRIFLDYIRERSGLLIERGRDRKMENLFSFVHLSFQEYLCAWRLAGDKSKSQGELIREILTHMGTPSWEEPVLLMLYLLSASSGDEPFLDEFCRSAFEHLGKNPAEEAWLLLGRAVRDNLDFAGDDIQRICRELCAIWINNTDKSRSEKVLNEIITFSGEGKKRLTEIIKEEIKTREAPKAFAFIYLYKTLPGSDILPEDSLGENRDWDNLGAYLPVYRHKGVIPDKILEQVSAAQWRRYYASVGDSATGMADRLLKGAVGKSENAGYITDAWRAIVAMFENRRRFISKNKNNPGITGIETITIRFGAFASSEHPLEWSKPFKDLARIEKDEIIADPRWRRAALNGEAGVNDTFFCQWLENLFLKHIAVLAPDMTPEEKSGFKATIKQHSRDFSRHLSRYLSLDFSLDFIRDFSLNFSRDFIRDFSRYFSRDFSRNFSRDLSLDFIRDLSRYLSQYLSRYLSRDLSRKLSLNSYFKNNEYTRKLFSDSKIVADGHKEDNDNHSKKKHQIIIRQLQQGDVQLADVIFLTLFEENFKNNLEVEYGAEKKNRRPTAQNDYPRILFPKKDSEPFLLILLWEYVWQTLMIHYAHLWLAWGNAGISDQKEMSKGEFIRMSEVFTEMAPFNHYFLNFAWNGYSEVFNARYDLSAAENALLLAAFISSAARTTLVAHLPCCGEHWEKTLAAAEVSDSLPVQIALAFYKLCISQDSKENEQKLPQLLKRLKKEDPQLYQLTGFSLRGE